MDRLTAFVEQAHRRVIRQRASRPVRRRLPSPAPTLIDGLTSFVLVAHLKLRLDLLKQNLKRHEMAMPKFQGLSDALDKLEFDLEYQAEKMHERIASAGDRGTAAVKKMGDQKVGFIEQRIADVERFIAKVEGTNGSPTSGGSQKPPGTVSGDTAVPPAEPGEKQVVTAEDVGHLTVNGVSTD